MTTPPPAGPPIDPRSGQPQQPGYGQQPGYAPQPGYPSASFGPPGVDPSAPYGRHPTTGQPYSDKQKLVAGLLQLFAGGFGAGRWYLGHNGVALAQLLTCGGLGVWALIDAIMMLMGNVTDKNGLPLRD